ncbi:MAG: nicotinate phosphoribosyltransferase [Oxalobacter sp.]|nr:nicotinate phosphoribosyltransferase [Oxalobacter sp.]
MNLRTPKNPAMVMDLYELTMAYGYFKESDWKAKAAFDLFYRKNPEGGGYAISAGLEQIIDYINNLHFSEADIDYLASLGLFGADFLDYLKDFSFKGDIYAFPEGTLIYPNEPVITVVAPRIDAQIVETSLLVHFNHQSLIATKASRIVRAAAGRAVSDMGARRAHNMDAAVYGARAAYIGGVGGTATVLAAQMFNIPAIGTMAHSWVMGFADEFTAFAKFAKTYPDSTVLLVDTYNVLKSGIPNAIRTAKEVLAPMGKRLKAIRIDSGDLAYLSKRSREMLDAAGFPDCRIIVSNSLDEYTITSLLNQDSAIDSFGVGERLITSRAEPVFGGVYKLAAVAEGGVFVPKIKISENVEKITNPGLKQVYRIFNDKEYAVADLIAGADEELDFSKPVPFIDPTAPWKKEAFTGCHAKALQVPVFKDGKQVYQCPSLNEIRDYVKDQLENKVWPEELRFENPHRHYLAMTENYYQMKMALLNQNNR